jgi:hypothetical protein
MASRSGLLSVLGVIFWEMTYPPLIMGGDLLHRGHLLALWYEDS